MDKYKITKKACAFTGHRSSKLPCIRDEQHPDTIRLRQTLNQEIFGFAMCECRTFYMGCGEGMDIIFGEEVLKVREQLGHIQLYCVPPYIGFEKTHKEPWRSRCEAIMEKADATINLGDHPVRGDYFIRNRFMVDHATDLLAVYNGGTGGTAYTIDYAQKLNRNITIFSLKRGKLWVTVNDQEKELDD